MLRRVWISDGFEQTKYMCTGDRREVIFTSSSNQATIFFSSTGQDSIPAKGFWLYYEGKLADCRFVRQGDPQARFHDEF